MAFDLVEALEALDAEKREKPTTRDVAEMLLDILNIGPRRADKKQPRAWLDGIATNDVHEFVDLGAVIKTLGGKITHDGKVTIIPPSVWMTDSISSGNRKDSTL